MQKKAVETITKITNRVDIALYNDKDLIVMMDEIMTNKSLKSSKSLQPSAIVNSRGVAY